MADQQTQMTNFQGAQGSCVVVFLLGLAMQKDTAAAPEETAQRCGVAQISQLLLHVQDCLCGRVLTPPACQAQRSDSTGTACLSGKE